MKKQNDVSGPYATVTLTDEHGDTKDQPFHEIVPDGFSFPSLDVLERKEMLPLTRSAHRATSPGVEETFSDVLPRELADMRDCGFFQSACVPDLRDPETNCRFARERPTEIYQWKMSPRKQPQQY